MLCSKKLHNHQQYYPTQAVFYQVCTCGTHYSVCLFIISEYSVCQMFQKFCLSVPPYVPSIYMCWQGIYTVCMTACILWQCGIFIVHVWKYFAMQTKMCRKKTPCPSRWWRCRLWMSPTDWKQASLTKVRMTTMRIQVIKWGHIQNNKFKACTAVGNQ